MIQFFKKLFGIEDERKTEETKRELHSKTYQRQREHHLKRMAASPDHFEFHQDMVRHCDKMLGEGPTKVVVPVRDTVVHSSNRVSDNQSYYRSDTSVSSDVSHDSSSWSGCDSSSSSCSSSSWD